MSGVKDVKTLFETELKQRLAALEAVRQAVMNPFWIALPIAVAVFWLGSKLNFSLFHGTSQAVVITTWVLAGGTLFVGGVFSGKRHRIYRKQFKDQVVAEILKLHNPQWQYLYDQCISQPDYYGSELFRHRVDRYQGDDLVRGRIGKTGFEFSELHTQYKTVTYDSKGRRQEHWHTIFKGLFFHADFNKHIKGKTFVLPDTAEALFGRLGKKMQSMNADRGELVHLEDPAFEKLFVVYGQDQIEPRYILTPKIMQNLTRLREKTGRNIHLSFVGTRVYVAVSFSKALFEPRLFRSGVRLEDMQEMMDLFGMMESIVEEMDLNNRIWTKA